VERPAGEPGRSAPDPGRSAPDPGASGPALSAILVARSGWPAVTSTVRCLAEQSVADRIEVVLVAVGGAPVAGDPPPAAAALAGHRVVEAPAARSVAEAYAAGVRAARAPVVVFGEDHAFPLPGWAEALLERHGQGYAVVGPVVRNGNPRTLTSWADFALGYGPYAEGHPGGDTETAPGHNSSYKRAVVEGADLDAEWVLHHELRARGERVCLEPRAVIRHTNFGRPRAFLAAAFHAGRNGAAARASAWRPARRAAYVAGSPLIPLVRLARTVRALPPGFPRRALPMLALGLAVDGAGQAAGFAGSRPARAALLDLELERVRFA
jgi:hypothetical protein